MNKKYRNRKTEVTRQHIRDIIPLRAPLGFGIDPTSVCNFNCRFCIHGAKDEAALQKLPLGFMDMNLYKKIIDDMKGFENKPKTLKLTGLGEPLLHPKIVEMVRYAKDADVVGDVSIITNASLLTREIADNLIDAGLDVLYVSIEGMSKESYLEVTGKEVDIDDIIEKVRYFYEHRKQCELYIKTIGSMCSEEEIALFKKTFSEISDYHYIEHLDLSGQGLGNFTDDERKYVEARYKGVEYARRNVCGEPFFNMGISWKGMCLSCVEDMYGEQVIGDANVENVVDIWNGEKANALRYAQLTRDVSSYPLCSRDCFKYSDIHCPSDDPDNIDNLPQEIIDKFKPNV